MAILILTLQKRLNNMYPQSYHAAMNVLINSTQPSRANRSVIARALRELRNTHSAWSGKDQKRITGREWARRERHHMLYVNNGPFYKHI